MRKLMWLAALAAVLAVGLLAAGCGGGDETTTVTAAEDTSTTSTEATSTTEETTTSEDSTTEVSGSTPDDVYNACIDAIEGTPVADTLKPQCEQARDAFQTCIDQADAAGGSAGDTAAQLCQDAADQTINGLKAAS